MTKLAAKLYTAYVEAKPDAADLPFDLLEPDKQAPWEAAARAAESMFLDGEFEIAAPADLTGEARARQLSAAREFEIATTPARDARESVHDLARYFRAAGLAAIRRLPPSRALSLVLTNVEQAFLWLGQAQR